MTRDESPTEPRHQKAPALPWKTRLSISIVSVLSDACRRSNGTVNRLISGFFDPLAPASAKPVRGVRTADVTVDPAHNLWFRLFVPVSESPDVQRLPVVVFFHGGGFAYLSAASRAYDIVCRRICLAIPAVVASVNYRLSPEHRHPAPYEDGEDVLRFLGSGALAAADKQASDLADLSNCFIAGDSAGANIAHHVARRWEATVSAGRGGALRVSGLVSIQPFFGGEQRTDAELRLAGAPLVSVERTDWMWRAFLPEGADRDHEAANVFGPRATELEEGFPPAMVVVGGFDPLQDWQRRYYEGLKARGREAALLEYPQAVHAFYVFPELKEGAELLQEMKAFVHKHSKRPTAAPTKL